MMRTPVTTRLSLARSSAAALLSALPKVLQVNPVPIMLAPRLAVATSWQGRGLGNGLFKDAMLRAVSAADIAGIRAFAVHANDEEVKSFYERFDFVAAPNGHTICSACLRISARL